jgi:hypothetical protein
VRGGSLGVVCGGYARACEHAAVAHRGDVQRCYVLAVVPAAAYAALTLAALFGIDCDVALDPQRFCVWWGHSWLPTALGLPAVLAFGCYASVERDSPRPAIVAAALVVLTCVYLRAAAAPVL